MNKVMVIGRTTSDIELKTTSTGKAVCNFTLAVPRKWGKKDENGKTITDFLRCQAWNKSAEILNQYAPKGKQIAVIGNLQSSSYDKDGIKQYKTEIIVEEIELLGNSKENKEPNDPFADIQVKNTELPPF